MPSEARACCHSILICVPQRLMRQGGAGHGPSSRAARGRGLRLTPVVSAPQLLPARSSPSHCVEARKLPSAEAPCGASTVPPAPAPLHAEASPFTISLETGPFVRRLLPFLFLRAPRGLHQGGQRVGARPATRLPRVAPLPSAAAAGLNKGCSATRAVRPC